MLLPVADLRAAFGLLGTRDVPESGFLFASRGAVCNRKSCESIENKKQQMRLRFLEDMGNDCQLIPSTEVQSWRRNLISPKRVLSNSEELQTLHQKQTLSFPVTGQFRCV